MRLDAVAMKTPKLRSIQLKVFSVIGAVTFAIVAFLTVYFPSRQIRMQRSALEQKAGSYGQLLGEETESAIAFQDRETAREAFDAIARDPDVRAIALYTERGTLLYALGEPSAPPPAFAPALRLQTTERSIACVSPVVSKEGPRGTLVIELSTDALLFERAEIRRTSILAALAALSAGFVAAWLIGSSLGRRLHAIVTVTNAVAGGDLSQRPLEDESADEVGQLARSFNGMLGKIQDLVGHISQAAAEEKLRLNALVALRTAELDTRNQDMLLVLENVGQGFLTLDRGGVMSRERSAIVDQWLGRGTEGATFWDHLASIDARGSAWFKLGWDAVTDDVLPLELALAQLPRTIAHSTAMLRIEYRPILAGGCLRRVLLIISDVTADVKRERAEAEQRETLAVFEHAGRDRAALAEFLAESEDLLRVVEDPSSTPIFVRRALHTLKGNSGSFGLFGIAEACHAMEDEMSESLARPSPGALTELAARWAKSASRAASLLGERRHTIELGDADHAELLSALGTDMTRSELIRIVTSWKLEPTATRLGRVAEETRALAKRLGKPAIVVRIEDNGLRLDPVRWAPFWSAFTHAVRNAVDHGIEAAGERGEKSHAGSILLRTYLSRSRVVVEIADDGRGIDWPALALRGRALGLAHDSQPALEEILFCDGVSTRLEATVHSGRGIGLGALRAACQALGGVVKLSSVRGEGTTLQFWIPSEPPGGMKSFGSSLHLPEPAA